jgi:hypothetical protein
MRHHIVSFALMMLVFQINAQSNDERDFVNFLSKFPLLEFPIKTKNLNAYKTYRKIAAKENLLKGGLCAKYFYAGDESKIKFEFESFNMETGKSMGKRTDQFGFYPAFRAEIKEYLLLCFLKTTLTSYEYHLAAFKKEEKNATDILEMNKVNEEQSTELYQYGAMEKNFRVQIFRYEQNPKFWQQKN